MSQLVLLVFLLFLGVMPHLWPLNEAFAQPSPTPPAYLQRGNEVEAHYQMFKERLQRFYDMLHTEVAKSAAHLLPQLDAATPQPLRHGYLVLPKLVPDAPLPAGGLRVASSSYSWPLTRQRIDREMQKLDGLEAELSRAVALPLVEQPDVYEKLVAEYRSFPAQQRLIDSHCQYNRLWQAEIARNRVGYERLTRLHDAVLERQALRDGLQAPDEETFRKALSAVAGVDRAQERNAILSVLRTREAELDRQIHEATAMNVPPSFLRIEHPTPHRWIFHVQVYTDIGDEQFLQAVQSRIETLWQVQDGEEEFRVQLSVVSISPAQLYEPATVPREGDAINLAAHLARFPKDGAVLTTGALTTHVLGSAIVLGPHDISPHTLAHEFGHILGFRDVYFRGFQDLGADGYRVMEVVANPDDIMGAPGFGPVLRRHFTDILDKLGAR